MSSERRKLIMKALGDYPKLKKGNRFEEIISALYDVEVLNFDLDSGANRECFRRISEAMQATCVTVQANPIERSRPNEVGNDMEPFVIDALIAVGLDAATPKTRDGKGKSTGYPDVRIETDGLPIYFEVKTYAAKNHDTTQRSFYLSPSDDPKVIEDAFHLLVGFEIEREGNLYWPVAFEIVDLYGLDCDMKAEFNSSNRRLYEPQRILAQERV